MICLSTQAVMIIDIADADNHKLLFHSKIFEVIDYNRNDQSSGVLCQFRDGQISATEVLNKIIRLLIPQQVTSAAQR